MLAEDRNVSARITSRAHGVLLSLVMHCAPDWSTHTQPHVIHFVPNNYRARLLFANAISPQTPLSSDRGIAAFQMNEAT